MIKEPFGLLVDKFVDELVSLSTSRTSRPVPICVTLLSNEMKSQQPESIEKMRKMLK